MSCEGGNGDISMTQNYLEQLLEISIALAAEKNRDVLLERILVAAMELTNCDGGTLYIKQDNALAFKVMITKSQNVIKGGAREEIELPPVPLERSNVCAYSAIEGRLINIPDVYDSDIFNFEGPIRYDAMIGYKTKSMMVVPMENNHGEVIGVMQLINAQNKDGEIISFKSTSKVVVRALAAQAAICITNMNYIMQVEDLMESIVRTISAAIHLRSPYNVTHTHNMAAYAQKFIAWLNSNKEVEWKFSELDERLFILSIWLHDIGKLITPLEIMNKSTRLDFRYDEVMARLDYISLSEEVNALRKGYDPTELLKEVEQIREFIAKVNVMEYLDDQNYKKVQKLSCKTFNTRNGNKKLWFKQDDIDALSIRKGTLTKKEFSVMQEHVLLTEKILSKMSFWGEYAKVPRWASKHHELLDGSGYPKKLDAENIDVEARLLTILDIFDGLTSHDRPYKKPFSLEKSFAIMREMIEENKLDKQVFELFFQSKAWELNDEDREKIKAKNIMQDVFN